MAFLDSINRFIAYRLKEIELRLHTRRRAKEISRAYDTKSADGAGFGTFALLAVKAAKICAVCAVVGAVVFGAIKVIPMIPSFSSDRDNAASDTLAETPFVPIELPEDAELPEAAVMPEGYAELATHAILADTAVITADAAEEPAAPPPPDGSALADIFKKGMPAGIAERVILGDKAAKILYIYKSTPSGWVIEKAYPMATGERDGRKQVEGDKKTPEGVYHIVGRKHRSELTNLYGPAAFITDYPNEEDRRERRTGHGIWIHGSERGNIPPKFTQGCMAVSNPDILEIAGILKPWVGVPVIIVSGTEGKKHLTSIDFNKLKARGAEVVENHNRNQAEFEKLVLDWKSAWESKDIDTYSSFYSTGTFMDGTQKWDAFRERKIRTFGMYATIHIELSGIVLTELTNNLATVKFNQLYTTNINRMDNAKRLIFRKEQGNWKIHREITFPKEELLL